MQNGDRQAVTLPGDNTLLASVSLILPIPSLWLLSPHYKVCKQNLCVWTSQGGNLSRSAPLSSLQSPNSGMCTFPLRGSCYLRVCHSCASAAKGLILELEMGRLWSGKFASRAINIRAINGLRCTATENKEHFPVGVSASFHSWKQSP